MSQSDFGCNSVCFYHPDTSFMKLIILLSTCVPTHFGHFENSLLISQLGLSHFMIYIKNLPFLRNALQVVQAYMLK